jgi:hypothetical protein
MIDRKKEFAAAVTSLMHLYTASVERGDHKNARRFHTCLHVLLDQHRQLDTDRPAQIDPEVAQMATQIAAPGGPAASVLDAVTRIGLGDPK